MYLPDLDNTPLSQALKNGLDWGMEDEKIAKGIPIKSINCLGVYNPMRCRPVSVEFECLGDMEYLIKNKRNLKKGIYIEREYGVETEEK